MQSQIKEVSVWVKSVNPELNQQLDEIVTDKENIPKSTSQEKETQLSEDMIFSMVTLTTQGRYEEKLKQGQHSKA